MSQPYDIQTRSIEQPITEKSILNSTVNSQKKIKKKHNRSNSRASRDASQDRIAQYTLSDLEKKIDKCENKQKRNKSKVRMISKERKTKSKENSMTRSAKSGDIAKRVLSRQRSLT